MNFVWLLFLLSLPWQLGRHFWFPFSYINGLRVDYLSPTLYLQDLIFLLILGLTFLQQHRYLSVKDTLQKPIYLHSFSPKRISIKYIILFLFFIFNLLFSISPWVTVHSFLRLGQFILLVLLSGRENKQIITALKLALPISAISQLLISVTQTITGHSIGGLLYWLGERSFNITTPDIAKVFVFGHYWLRPYGTFSHPNSLAGFMLLVLILGIILLKGKVKTLTVICSGLLIILSFSQSAWLGLFIICSYIYLLYHRISLRGVFISLLVYISIAIFVLYLSCGYIFNDPSFVLRLSLLKVSWPIFLTQPIFGVGLGNYIIALGQQNEFARLIHWYQPVHNIFVLWIVETGIVGVGIVLYLCCSVFNVSPRRPLYTLNFIENLRCLPPKLIRDRLVKSLTLLLIVIGITGFFDHYWLTLIQNRLLLAICLGIIKSHNKIQPND